jgi:hypothetical protein
VVRATPAASAICSTVAAGFADSTRSAASRIARIVRSVSARIGFVGAVFAMGLGSFRPWGRP